MKIVTSYILIIISSLIIVGVVFGLLARAYTERQVKTQLVRDVGAIHEIITNETSENAESLATETIQAIRKKILNKAGSLQSSFVLVSRNMKVLYPKNGDASLFEEKILPQLEGRLNANSKKTVTFKLTIDGVKYMFAVMPPKSNITKGLKGWMILYSAVEPIQKMMSSMLLVLMVSLVISACMAALAGIFFARGIAKPIIMLKNRAAALSKRDFDGAVEINTGDELEELGTTINKMAKDLKEYDITQKRFFQNASHELKTPLMSIQGYAEGIKDGVFENNEEALDIIVDESKRLKSIVEELIFLSKTETQGDFYKFAPASINEVIEKSVEKLKGLSVKDNIKISLVLYNDAQLYIDRDKITQALINIMGNCLRYARNEVSIFTANTGSSFEIIIQDDGEGFEQSELGKVFERFYKGKKGSSGLGLAITKAIIEKHNGTIAVSNHSGGGAEFRIVMPIPD